MASRTWARILLVALGVAALAGASQLGVAYGLGVVRLTRVFDVAVRDQWNAQLAWAAWIAMVAAVAGALAGGWCHRRWAGPGASDRADDRPDDATGRGDDVTAAGHAEGRPVRPGLWTMVALAVAAGAGALVVVPLTMQPARTAMVAANDPALVMGICAGLGALAGAFAGYAALAHVLVRWSIGVLTATLWLLAVVSVLPSLGLRDPLPAVRLGVFDAGFLARTTTQRFAVFTLPAVALLAGAALGWMARRRDFPPMTIALAGLPGPALVTLAYLIAGPGAGGQRYQAVPYWAAMAAAGTGVLGAVIAATIRRGDEADDSATAPAPADDTVETGGGSALPRRSPGRPVDEPPVGPFGPRPTGSAAFAGAGVTARQPESGPNPGTLSPGAAARPAGAGPDATAGRPAFGEAPSEPDPAEHARPRGSVHGPLGRGLTGFRPEGVAPPAAPPQAQSHVAEPHPAAYRPVAPHVPQPRQVSPPVVYPAPSPSPAVRPTFGAPRPVPRAEAPPAFGPPRQADPHTGLGRPETNHGADRDDPTGRRPGPGADVPLRSTDADFVDWVSGLGGDRSA